MQPVIDGKNDWLFPNPQNTLVFTTTYVQSKQYPILEVYHDEDGDWQFMCGTTNTSADGLLVCIGHVLNWDPTLALLHDLEPGHCAIRTEPGKEWKRARHVSQD